MRLWRPSVLLGLWLVLAAAPSRAGWISELSPWPQVGLDRQNVPATLAPWIEVSGVAGLGALDLVIIDATPGSRYGNIQQVVTLGTGLGGSGPEVRVALAGDGPDDRAPPWWLWPLPPGGTTEIAAGSMKVLDAQKRLMSRSILLFDRPTGLTVLHGNIRGYVLAGVQLLDVLTFGPPGAATRAWGAEPVLHLPSGAAVARPQRPGSSADPLYLRGPADPGEYLVGAPDLYGRLTEPQPVYDGLNPGLLNPIWAPRPQHQPEPGGALAALLGLLVLGRVRR